MVEKSIEDMLAIRSLIEGYSDAVNRQAASALADLWSDDGRWSVPEAEGLENVVGRSAIVETWQGLLGLFEIAFFLCVPGTIEIDGAAAKTRTYGQELTKLHGGAMSVGVGYYDDRFVKIDGRWYFAERVWHTVSRYTPQVA